MFRASYTTLKFWESGNKEQAIAAYYKLPREETPQMLSGKLIHQQFETEIKRRKALPKVFGTKQFKSPMVELKRELLMDDWLTLVGVIDCFDEDTIYDWKTGVTTSEVYAATMQPKVYQLLMESANRFEIHHYNQYTNEVDMSIGFLTSKTAAKADEWVRTLSKDMYHYLQKYGGKQ